MTDPARSSAEHVPSASLTLARELRDDLARLLTRERTAAAEFLLALADFDRRRGWELLGHASLFAFLRVELGLSSGAAFWRMSAARLLQRFPDAIEPLRDGRLCLSTTAELAKVLTAENREEVLPRFFGLSAREAKEVTASLVPRESPPLRAVVTSLAPVGPARTASVPAVPPAAPGECEAPSALAGAPVLRPEPMALAGAPVLRPEPMALAGAPVLRPEPTALAGAPARREELAAPATLISFRTSETESTHPARVAACDDVEPLTADLRRLHVTVSRGFLQKVATARDGLAHAVPGASTEQVLEAALDLLLEKQARARGQVKRPRGTAASHRGGGAPQRSSLGSGPGLAPGGAPAEARQAVEGGRLAAGFGAGPDVASGASAPSLLADPPPPRRDGPREHVPAAVRRAVWERDGGRCQWPLDLGGCCGSTFRLEVDHVHPWARGGAPTVEGLRLLCHRHNVLAARLAFGERCVGRYRGGSVLPNDAAR